MLVFYAQLLDGSFEDHGSLLRRDLDDVWAWLNREQALPAKCLSHLEQAFPVEPRTWRAESAYAIVNSFYGLIGSVEEGLPGEMFHMGESGLAIIDGAVDMLVSRSENERLKLAALQVEIARQVSDLIGWMSRIPFRL